MVWAGTLTDRFRVRTLGPAVLAGLAVACAVMVWNSLVPVLLGTVFFLRLFGQGMCSHIAVVAMSRWFIANRGKALSIAALGFSLGEAILPLTFVALMTMIDWHYLWLLSGLFCLASIPVLAGLLRQERTPQSISTGHSSAGMGGLQWTRKDALSNPLFWFMVPALLGPSAFNTAFFFHQVHFAEINGWPHVHLVALFPLYTGLGIAAMIVSGWALDKWGTARLLPFYQLPLVVAFFLFATADTIADAVLGLVFLAMTTGANSTLPNAFWAEFYGTAHIGSIKAMAAAIMVLGSAIGPGITGLLIDRGIDLDTQFLGVSAYFVFTTLMMYVGVSRARPALARV